MESQIRIFEATREDGIFSISKKFYPKGTLKRERIKLFHEDRLRLGKKLGIDGNHIFRAYQKGEYKPDVDYADGKYIIIGKENMRKKDYFNEILPADILIISKEYPHIAIANPSADCPILICEDRKKGYTALAHCGGKHINRNLPKDAIKAMIKGCNSNVEDLYVYIGSCIKKESYVYDKYPKWATNKKLWKDNIIEKEGNYYINLIGAIEKQLQEIGITQLEISPINSATNPKYCSHSAAHSGDKSKLGQNFIGFYYK